MKLKSIRVFAGSLLLLSLSGCNPDECAIEKISAFMESFFKRIEEYAQEFDDAESDVLDYVKEQGLVTSTKTVGLKHKQSSVRKFANGALFSEPKEIISTPVLEIMQVTPRHCTALAFTNNLELVLFYGNENEHYRDSQTIKVPPSKKLYRIGTYRYETTEHFEKTVSIVIMK